MFQAILNAIRNLLIAGETVVKNILIWFWGTLWSLLDTVLGGLPQPEYLLQYISGFPWYTEAAEYFSTINDWIPIWFGLQLFVLYWTFYIGLVPVRFVLRHLPLVGGGGSA